METTTTTTMEIKTKKQLSRDVITKNLKKIYDKYENKNNNNNYHIGGGLVAYKFASNRHEDALNDSAKLTLGKLTSLLIRATGKELFKIIEIIKFSTPNLEWHHAGKLPKEYGGGMKKTYFLNAREICNIAENYFDIIDKLNLHKAQLQKNQYNAKLSNDLKHLFLLENATKIVRIIDKPTYFYQTKQEMLGKYGWFDCHDKNYNLVEYYTGWAFESEELYKQYLEIQ